MDGCDQKLQEMKQKEKNGVQIPMNLRESTTKVSSLLPEDKDTSVAMKEWRPEAGKIPESRGCIQRGPQEGSHQLQSFRDFYLSEIAPSGRTASPGGPELEREEQPPPPSPTIPTHL